MLLRRILVALGLEHSPVSYTHLDVYKRQAVDIVYKRELDAAANREQVRREKIEEFRDRFANPYAVADRGFVDAVIQPRDTRKKLIQALAMLETKRDKNPPKKHGNIPL